MGVTRSLFAVAAAAALAALLAADVRLSGDAAAQSNVPVHAAGARAGIAAQGVIEHVVVIVQENRTFDNLFGGYVNASPLGPQAYPHANSTYPPEIVKYLRATNIDDGSGDNTHDSYACLNQSLPGEARFSSQRWIAVSKHAIGPAPCSDPNKGLFVLSLRATGAAPSLLGDRAQVRPGRPVLRGDVVGVVPAAPVHRRRRRVLLRAEYDLGRSRLRSAVELSARMFRSSLVLDGPGGRAGRVLGVSLDPRFIRAAAIRARPTATG